MKRWLRGVSWIVFFWAGCSGGEEPRVPFKLRAPNAPPDETPAPVETERVQGAETSSSPTPLRSPRVDGAELTTDFVRAWVAVDLDGDADRDVLVARLTDAALFVDVFLRAPGGFEAPRTLQQLAFATGCAGDEPAFAVLSSTEAAFSFTERCADAGQARTHLWLVALEAAPRLLERFAVRSEGERALAVVPAVRDVDADGHVDTVLELTLTDPRLAAPRVLALPWLDRVNGLVRDAREPAAALTALAGPAADLVRKDPGAARDAAWAVIAFEEALCSDARAPLLRVADAEGLTCAELPPVWSAWSTLGRASGALGDVAGATRAWVALAQVGKSAEKARAEVARALGSQKPTAGVTLQKGPAVEALASSQLHLPAARFLSESLLYVRRHEPVIFDLVQGRETSAEPASDELRDPSGRFVLRALEQSCEALRLRIVPVGRDELTEAALYAPVAALHAPCRSAGQASSAALAGIVVLGWAPQGIVLARGGDVTLVPMSAAGQPLGEPRQLGPEVGLPAPLTAGPAAADGSRHALVTPYGLVLFTRGGAELWRPEGFAEIAAKVTDIALSASGKRVALVAGGYVYLMAAGPNG